MITETELSDEQIALKASHERLLFSILVERYQTKLERYIKRLGIWQKEEVEDILQEVFIKVYKNLQGFDTSLSFSSWIYRIAHNETVSFFRKKNLRPQGHYVNEPEKILADTKNETDLEKELDIKINAEKIMIGLEKINKRFREILVLRYFEQKSYQEISDILRLPMGSVATLIFRAKKALQKKLRPFS